MRGSLFGDKWHLHEGRNALEGKSQERIWHEIRPVSCERIKTPRGFEKPEGGGVVGIGNR
jgi:hypothetical protein